MLGYLEPARSGPRRCCATAGTSPATSRVIDDDGFIRITDRLSRFSKIGGEMVPHLKIEEAIGKRDRRAPRAPSPACPTSTAASGWWCFYTRPGDYGPELWQRLSDERPAATLAAQAREHLPGGVAADSRHRQDWTCAR